MSLDFAKARQNMLDSQVRTNDVTDLVVQDAMAVVPRERFCRLGAQALAYAEVAPEYAPGWRLLEPRDIAKLLQAIFPRPGERALCIAAPYAAAVLAQAGLSVRLIVAAGEAEAASRAALAGTAVVIEAAPDLKAVVAPPDQSVGVVVCEGAVTTPPEGWLAAVGVGGRMGVVERRGPVALGCLYRRGPDGLLARREVFDAAAPYLPGFEPERGFVF